MITFLIGAMVGAVVGVGTMCFMAVAAEEYRWLEKKQREYLEAKLRYPGAMILTEERHDGRSEYQSH